MQITLYAWRAMSLLMADPVPTNQELAALKRQFDEQVTRLHDRIDEVESQKNAAIRALDATAAELGISRRALLTAIGGAGGLSALGVFGAQEAQGAPQPSGGEGDFGSPSSPWEGWSDGLARVTESVSSATTVTKHVIPYDCSVSGFTITIGQELEPQSGFATKVVLIDETGNAGSNAVTVGTESGNGIDGGSSITINHDNAVTTLYWDGAEWRSTRFIDTVDAGTVIPSEVLEFGAATETVSSNAISYSAPKIVVSGGGSSATLDTINGGSDGDFVVLVGGSDSITVSETGGNLNINGDHTLTADRTITLLFVSGSSVWTEISRAAP